MNIVITDITPSAGDSNGDTVHFTLDDAALTYEVWSSQHGGGSDFFDASGMAWSHDDDEAGEKLGEYLDHVLNQWYERWQEVVAPAIEAAVEKTIAAVESFDEWNDDEPDGAPCCPDPECGRNPCTFPGYAANH